MFTLVLIVLLAAEGGRLRCQRRRRRSVILNAWRAVRCVLSPPPSCRAVERCEPCCHAPLRAVILDAASAVRAVIAPPDLAPRSLYDSVHPLDLEMLYGGPVVLLSVLELVGCGPAVTGPLCVLTPVDAKGKEVSRERVATLPLPAPVGKWDEVFCFSKVPPPRARVCVCVSPCPCV